MRTALKHVRRLAPWAVVMSASLYASWITVGALPFDFFVFTGVRFPMAMMLSHAVWHLTFNRFDADDDPWLAVAVYGLTLFAAILA